jgi:hypothetical protein
MPLKAYSEQLQKLFRLIFSSDQAGEVVGARDAILRIGKKEGADLFELTKIFASGLEPKIVYRDRPPTVEASPRDIALWCLDQFHSGGLCNPREYQFVSDMTRRWGPATEKQAKWLAAIRARLMRELRQ